MTSQHWAEFADWHPADIYAAFYPEVDQDVGLSLQNLAQRRPIMATRFSTGKTACSLAFVLPFTPTLGMRGELNAKGGSLELS